MEKNVILQGDCLEALKTLPDKSVNCCVTSPPYYGLRDYGTGEWVGGDPNCKHVTTGISNNRNFINKDGRGGNNPSIGGTVCKLCGAVKEDKQVGLEETPEAYIDKLVAIFREVKRVLMDDGTLWVNIGDSYATHASGSKKSSYNFKSPEVAAENGIGTLDKPTAKSIGLKEKDLIGIPWMLAFALRNDGWYLRQDIIWHKSCPMPESVKDRCTKSHEYVFLLSKSSKYYFDNKAIQEVATGYDGRSATKLQGGTKWANADYMFNQSAQTMAVDGAERWNFENGIPVRNKRDVWTVNPSHYKEAHFATFPEELIKPMILAGCPEGGIVLDPFMGSGTTAVVARKLYRNYIGTELNPKYIEMANNRIKGTFVPHRLF